MASITPTNGRAAFVAAWDPHTYWELNSTNLGTNYGDDTSGNDDNSNVSSGDLSTQESYEGMNNQNDPPASGWFDIYTVTDAAMLIYIPAGLAHGTCYGLFHNGGGTNAQSGFLRATTTGVEIACNHNTGGDTNHDGLIYEIPDADLPGWFALGFQFSSEGGAQGDMGLWVNGTKVRNATRTYQLAYGSGNPDFGNSGGREPNASTIRDPSSYGGGDWGNNNAITSSGILIANFTCDNPNQTNSSPAGNGDTFYTDYYDDHVVSAQPLEPALVTQAATASAPTVSAPGPTQNITPALVSQLLAALAPAVGLEVVEVVAASGDDILFAGSSYMNAAATDNWLGNWSAQGDEHMWLRFTSVAVPKDATVISAKVLFEVDTEYLVDDVVARITCNDIDDASNPASNAAFQALADTTAYTDWTVSTGYSSGDPIETPNFSSAVEEVFARSGWASGNDLGVIILSTTTATDEEIGVFAEDDVTGDAPILTIVYAPSSALNITPAMVTQALTGVDPELAAGNVDIDPAAVANAINALAPTVKGFVNLDPALVSQLLSAPSPTITTGAVAISPATVSQLVGATDPTIQTGVVIITPAAGTKTMAATDPAVQAGAVQLTPTLVSQLLAGIDPEVMNLSGPQSITMGAVANLLAAADPTIAVAGTYIEPDATSNLIAAFDGAVFADQPIDPALASNLLVALAPTLETGPVTILPAVQALPLTAVDPTIPVPLAVISPAVVDQIIEAYPLIVIGGVVYSWPSRSSLLSQTLRSTVSDGTSDGVVGGSGTHTTPGSSGAGSTMGASGNETET